MNMTLSEETTTTKKKTPLERWSNSNSTPCQTGAGVDSPEHAVPPIPSGMEQPQRRRRAVVSPRSDGVNIVSCSQEQEHFSSGTGPWCSLSAACRNKSISPPGLVRGAPAAFRVPPRLCAPPLPLGLLSWRPHKHLLKFP